MRACGGSSTGGATFRRSTSSQATSAHAEAAIQEAQSPEAAIQEAQPPVRPPGEPGTTPTLKSQKAPSVSGTSGTPNSHQRGRGRSHQRCKFTQTASVDTGKETVTKAPRSQQEKVRESTTSPVRAIAIYAAPTKVKIGEMRHWLEEDNNNLAIVEERWLLGGGRWSGKSYSSLVIYLGTPTGVQTLQMGRKSLRTTDYAWDRGIRS